MCEFCVSHGDGKRWYLNAANYSEDLLRDAARAEYIRDFVPTVTGAGKRWLRVLDRSLARAPRLTRRVLRIQSERMKKVHFVQVIPIEEVEAILATVGHVSRVPCVCRETLQKRQEGACFLLAASPDRLGMADLIGSRPEGEPFVAGIERLTAAQAMEAMRDLERRGMIHTVWTFVTPFISAICNCDPEGCLAMNYTRRGLALYFAGEDVASVDAGACAGCGECVGRCLFDALAAGPDGRVAVDAARCHGCGICRVACESGALSLSPR